MKHGIFLILTLLSFGAFAQQGSTLSLQEVQQLAELHFPLLRQDDLQRQSHVLRQQNIKAAYLPDISLKGTASYQSEVVQLPFSMPGVENPELPNERWQLFLDISQPIYTGGSKTIRQALEEQQLAIDLQQQQISLQQLKPLVLQQYFSVVLSRQSEEILQSTRQLLAEKLQTLEAAVRGGIALPSEVLRVRSEISRLEQLLEETAARQLASLQSLSLLTGTNISEETAFLLPEFSQQADGLDRPELQLFTMQSDQLASRSRLLQTQLKPALSAFAQGGLGYPNPFNFFDASTSPYYQAGLRLQWQFWDWHKTSREQQQLSLQQQMLDAQQSNLERNIRIRLEQLEADMARYQAMIRQDEELIGLQQEIRQYASRQLDQGVITSTDYLNDVHAEQTARLNYSLHQMQLVQAQIAYLTEKGIY